MQLVVRASVVFLFLWLVTRAMGRKELSEMTSFDLVLIIVMGDLIQQGVTQQDNSLTGAIVAVSTFVLWLLAFSYLSFRFSRARTILQGRPVIVIRRGSPIKEALAAERLTLDEVMDAAREQGIDDLADVDVGIIEADGKFSFLRDDGRRPTRQSERSE